jgi:hypothetical protein
MHAAPRSNPARPPAEPSRPGLPEHAAVTRFEIRDASGTLAAIHCRQDGPDGKRMWWERPDGRRGLDGLPLADLPLYGIHRLDGRSTVVLTEGEKAADALHVAGVPAVGTVTGAAAMPGRTPLAELTGRSVILWADCDDVGRTHMERVGAGLVGIAADVRRIEWPDAGEHDDAADYLARGLDPWDVIDAAVLVGTCEAEPAAPSGMTLEDFIAAGASGCSWHLPGRIPDAGITLFAGEPRTFKTWAALQLLLAIAAGEPFMGTEPARSGRVLYVAEEGARAKLAERLGRLAGSLQPPAGSVRIMHRLGTTLAAGEGWDRVRATVAAERPVLVVLDTLAALMVGDENSVRDMHDALRHIQALIAEYGVTVILLHHINKNGDGRPGKRLRGSSALWGAVDCIWTFTRDTANGLPQNAGTILVEPKDGDLERIRFAWDAETFLLGQDAAPRCTLEGIAEMAAVLEERGERVTADALQAEFAGVGRSWFRESLARAVAAGLLTRSGATRSLVYRSAERPDERPDESLFGEVDE